MRLVREQSSLKRMGKKERERGENGRRKNAWVWNRVQRREEINKSKKKRRWKKREQNGGERMRSEKNESE